MKFLITLLYLATASLAFAEGKLPPGHPPVSADHAPVPAATAQLPLKGKVLDVISVPQYTYVEVSVDKASRWLAGPTVNVKKGDTVSFNDGLEMKDFHSNALDRTFPVIYFVNSIVVGE